MPGRSRPSLSLAARASLRSATGAQRRSDLVRCAALCYWLLSLEVPLHNRLRLSSFALLVVAAAGFVACSSTSDTTDDDAGAGGSAGSAGSGGAAGGDAKPEGSAGSAGVGGSAGDDAGDDAATGTVALPAACGVTDLQECNPLDNTGCSGGAASR